MLVEKGESAGLNGGPMYLEVIFARWALFINFHGNINLAYLPLYIDNSKSVMTSIF